MLCSQAPFVDLQRQRSPDSSSNGDSTPILGTSPISPLEPASAWASAHVKPFASHHAALAAPAPTPPPAPRRAGASADLLTVGLQTLVGTSELLGHALEDRDSISAQQDAALMRELQASSSTPLRDESQQPLFIVAPLDVLVTRGGGRNTCHIIEINGTGIAGITNMTSKVVQTIMASISELPQRLQHLQDPVILVASSGQESLPPVSRTMHEKMLYIEALRKGWEALGRTCHVTNMARLEKQPSSMPASGVTLVLGYMKQFRKHFMLDSAGRLVLMGRQVHAAINDRFVLNTMYQFDHKINLCEFMGYNMCFSAGADKGVAYELYNCFFDGDAKGRFDCMAPRINFERAFTRNELVGKVQSWLQMHKQPVLIKPQGTGCGHGIEFFFGDESQPELEAKVDAAIRSVASNYSLDCGGLPFTVCEFLDTATVCSEAGTQHGHKFEMRIVVYREGDELKAFPSIAKVARSAYDPSDPSRDKGALINNITTSAKESCQAGSEFMLPLCNKETLALLGVSVQELKELSAACTSFIRYVLDQLQDDPQRFGLPASAVPARPAH